MKATTHAGIAGKRVTTPRRDLTFSSTPVLSISNILNEKSVLASVVPVQYSASITNTWYSVMVPASWMSKKLKNGNGSDRK